MPRGKLVPEVGRILTIVKKYNMVLANGHVSPRETFALFEAAKAMGINKMVVTHGLWVNGSVKFTLDEFEEAGGDGGPISSTATWDSCRPISGTTRSRWQTRLSSSAPSTASSVPI